MNACRPRSCIPPLLFGLAIEADHKFKSRWLIDHLHKLGFSVGVDRSLDDIENWKSRDPIVRLSRAMIKEGMWSEAEELTINEQLDIGIAQAWEQAMGDPYPDSDSTLKYVYSSNSLKG